MMEKLRKVRSFSELRIGQIVVVEDCSLCGKAHRGILVNFDDAFMCERADDGTLIEEPSFGQLPACPLSLPDCFDCVCPSDVDDGTVYIVEDGLKTGVREPADAKAAP